MSTKRDPRVQILEAAVGWYQRALAANENLAIASLGLYVAHGAPCGEKGDAGASGLAIWLHYETWTTTN